MRKLFLATTLLVPACAWAAPPLTPAGGIAAPGPKPSYVIDPVTGTGKFSILDPNAAIGSSATTLGGMLTAIGTVSSAASAAQATANAAVAAAGGDASATVATSTGSTTQRSAADRGAETINVMDYGAVPDMVFLYDAFSVVAGSATISAPNYHFPPSAVGKTIVVPGAGPGGIALVTTITAAAGTSATMANTASVSTTTTNLMPMAFGTDNTAAINAAVAAARLRYSRTATLAWFNVRVAFPSGKASGTYLAAGSLNFTRITWPGFQVDMQGATIHSVAAGQVALDVVGSNHTNWNNLALSGDQYAMPRIGLQLGRTGITGGTLGNSSDVNSFIRPYIRGYFALADVLNEQSETSLWLAPIIDNKADKAYAAVFDGVNHFCMSSAFVAASAFTQGCGVGTSAVNGGESNQAFGENSILGGALSTSGAGSIPFFLSGSSRTKLDETYLAQTDNTSGTAKYEIQLYLYANGSSIQQPILDVHSEATATAIVELTGPSGVTTASVPSLHYRDNGAWTSGSVFAIDPASALTAVSLPNADIDLLAVTTQSATLFDRPSSYSMSGHVFLPSTMSLSGTGWSGERCQGIVCTYEGAIPQSTITNGLSNQGINTSNFVASVALTQNSPGYYITTTTAPYQIPLTFSAAPSGGTTATGLVTLFGTYGGLLTTAGTAGTDTYADNGVYALKDASGNTLPFTVQVRASGGVITSIVGFTVVHPISGYSLPAFSFPGNQVPQGPFAIVQTDGSGTATIAQMSLPPLAATLTNQGAGYQTPPTVTAGAQANLAGSNPYTWTAKMGSTVSVSSLSAGAVQAGPGGLTSTAGPTTLGATTATAPALADDSAAVITSDWARNWLVTYGYAPLASPALTGTPTAPTAAPGTNTTQIATTAFDAAAVAAEATRANGYADAKTGGTQAGSFTTMTAGKTVVSGVTAGSDKANGSLEIGAVPATATSTVTPHIDLTAYGLVNGSYVSQTSRFISDAPGQVSLLLNGAQALVMSPNAFYDFLPTVMTQPLYVQASAQFRSSVVTGTGSTYTLAVGDCGSTLRDAGSTAHTFTVPSGLPVGCKVDVIQGGSSGPITFAGAAGVTVEQAGSGTLTHTTAGLYARASILIDTANTFLLSGQVQ